MRKLVYLIVVIVALGLIVSGCLPVVPPSDQDESVTLPTKSPGDVYNTTQDKYYDTIQKAIDNAVDSDTIEVAAGTYNERITIKKALTIKSTNGAAQTIITEAGLSTPNPDVLIQIPANVNDVTIDGFTLNGDQFNTVADTSVIRVGGSAGGGPNSNVVITNNVINGMFGIIWRGGHTLTISDNIFIVNKNGVAAVDATTTNVVISDNTIGPGTSMIDDPSGIYATNLDNCQITGNTITDIVGSDGFGEGIMVPRGNNVVISGNTLTGNGMGGIHWWDSATSYRITNNVISNNGYGNHPPDTRNDGINIGAGIDININNNNIVGNAGDGIDSLVVVDATCNWWGKATGPHHEIDNPLGTGNAVSSNVDFKPWLLGPAPDTVCCDYNGYCFEEIAACAIKAENHGQFVSCVAKLTNNWLKNGDITAEDKATIMSWAAKSDIGKK